MAGPRLARTTLAAAVAAFSWGCVATHPVLPARTLGAGRGEYTAVLQAHSVAQQVDRPLTATGRATTFSGELAYRHGFADTQDLLVHVGGGGLGMGFQFGEKDEHFAAAGRGGLRTRLDGKALVGDAVLAAAFQWTPAPPVHLMVQPWLGQIVLLAWLTGPGEALPAPPDRTVFGADAAIAVEVTKTVRLMGTFGYSSRPLQTDGANDPHQAAWTAGLAISLSPLSQHAPSGAAAMGSGPSGYADAGRGAGGEGSAQ